MDAVGAEPLRQGGPAAEQGSDVARLRSADQRLGNGADIFIARIDRRRDQKTGDIGDVQHAFEPRQEITQKNAAGNQFGRRGEIEPAGFGGGDRLTPCPGRS
jgi:hypothetical protein